MTGHRFTAALVVAGALALMGAPAALADAQTLSVEGSGSVELTPDQANLELTVERTATRSAAALSATNRRADSVINGLRALGIAAEGIQTQDVSVSSRVVTVGPHKRRVRRFTASETLSVTVTKISLVGRVIDVAIGKGADSVDGPSFSFSDPSAGKIAATRAAIADARRRADDAAAVMGYKVTGVESVQLDPQSQVVTTGSAGASAPSAPAVRSTPTSVHPGTEEVDAQVAVVYTIAPA